MVYPLKRSCAYKTFWQTEGRTGDLTNGKTGWLLYNTTKLWTIFFFDFCSAWSFVFSSPPQPPMTSDFEGFSIPDLIHYIYFPILIRVSSFPFECSVLNKGTTGTIFITSLVLRGPWLWIEPGTSRIRSQHYTTRLSRRWYIVPLNLFTFRRHVMYEVNVSCPVLHFYTYVLIRYTNVK